jgi:23S rRNA (adenine-N6)-dimethyltransferase
MQASHRAARRPARSAEGARLDNRKILSQNFLCGRHGIDEFMSAIDVSPTDLVLEVGAGSGVLTEAIAQRCRTLYAYEIDRNLIPRLQERVGRFGNVHVVAADFLASDPPAESFIVVGNIPFSLTSAVVDWCLRASMLQSATIISQLEYAKKRTGGYGRWSLRTISTWPWFNWTLRGRIARTEYRPMPSVDTGILYIARRRVPLIRVPLIKPAHKASYQRLVEIGFSGVGGSLYKSLIRYYSRTAVDRAVENAGVRRDVVVAYVAPEQWLRIFIALSGERG